MKKILLFFFIRLRGLLLKMLCLLGCHPKVLSMKDSLSFILRQRISISRYGDGEILLMEGYSIGFQKKNKALAGRLKEIARNPIPGHRVCIPGVFTRLSSFNKKSEKFWKDFLFTNNGLTLFNKYFRSGPYLNTQISRFYADWKDKTEAPSYISFWREIFHGRHLLLVEGTGSKLGFYNDLFEGAASIRRIVCPAENAFDHYHAILETTLNKTQGTDDLVLIALGPTATVLAYDLARAGVQALDVGHIDIEYEWFKMKATSKVPVPWRYVNEAGSTVSEMSSEPEYTSQVIAQIGLS